MRLDTVIGTGEVSVCKREGALRAGAIGSCVVVTAYDPESRVGGMAHVMLPGSSPNGGTNKTRYAANAVDELMSRLDELGAGGRALRVCLVGGANVLGDGHYTPGPEIVAYLKRILAARGIRPDAVDVGGTDRRSCTLDVANGRVMYTVGDRAPRVLWEAETDGFGNERERRRAVSGRQA
jgi:chemotaxis protein CheD